MVYNDNSYGLFQGSLFLQRRALNGAPLGGFIPVGDADKFEITPAQTFDDVKESRSGLRMTAAHIPTGTDIRVKANLLFASKDSLAKALWGTDTGAVLPGTVVGEILPAYNNSIAPLAHLGVSTVVLALAGTATHIASIAVTAAGTGYTPNTALPMTLTASVGQAAWAITGPSGTVVGVVVTGTGTTLATAATITTPGAGTGATFAINAGATALVLGTDYIVDAANGSVSFLAGSTRVPAYTDAYAVGAVASAVSTGGRTSVTASYAYAGYAGKIEAFTTGIQYFSLLLQGVNVANSNQPIIVNVRQAALDIAKMFAFIDSKHSNLELDGMLLQDTTLPLATAASPFSQFFSITKA